MYRDLPPRHEEYAHADPWLREGPCPKCAEAGTFSGFTKLMSPLLYVMQCHKCRLEWLSHTKETP